MDSSFQYESIQPRRLSARDRLWGRVLHRLTVTQIPGSEHTALSQVCVSVWGTNKDWKIRGGCPSNFQGLKDNSNPKKQNRLEVRQKLLVYLQPGWELFWNKFQVFAASFKRLRLKIIRSCVCVCVCVCVLVNQLCPTLCNPPVCSPPSSSVHGILQARILEWVAISFSRGSSRPRNWTWVSCIAGRFFTWTLWTEKMKTIFF